MSDIRKRDKRPFYVISEEAYQESQSKKAQSSLHKIPEYNPMTSYISTYSKNIILYGPPGTGKTFGTIDLAIDIIDGPSNSNHKQKKVRYDQLRKEGQIEFVTFHQNYSYEDFVVGIKPDVDTDTAGLRFEKREGIFYKISKRSETNFRGSLVGGNIQIKSFEEVIEELTVKVQVGEIELETKAGYPLYITWDKDKQKLMYRRSTGAAYDLSLSSLKKSYEGTAEQYNNQRTYYNPIADLLRKEAEVKLVTPNVLKSFVLIIDEINRANMSRVFGELITLLEDDKRLGAENELTVTLSSGESFALPPNLYLIGTMNTADKSLALLDIALRRRFEFIYTKPDPELLESKAKEVLKKLNQAIRDEHKPADFLIGHAYFMGKDGSQLPEVFDNRVTPLLMEYFNGKVQTVIKVLDKAGVKAIADPITDELKVSYVE
ncbi:AAA family ATPase [Fibrella sp. HMF5405]|uniref:AAA family ATPase n=2 Tax=Fibrella forsythiae TaxID=2817061 RepID=A0ABS3JPT4_9BACT|nr:AAA family ATPase [Fibrella forsythiae]